MHLVICKYCTKKFDRDKEPFVQVSARRYAHKKCAENYENNKTQEQKNQEQLEEYIMKLFNEPYINARIQKQLKEYQEQYHYTYSGMLKTLIWWFEVKGNSIEKANGGIGIIPYVYEQACNYYYALYLAKLANEEKDITQFIPKTKEIVIESPRVYIKPHKLFNMEDN